MFLKVSDVKKNIETVQGADVYPASQQMLIYQGKVLKDTTTLGENNVAENSFIVIMLSKVFFIFSFGIRISFKFYRWKDGKMCYCQLGKVPICNELYSYFFNFYVQVMKKSAMLITHEYV